MLIKLKQFGTSLSSRQAGKDAYGGLQTMLAKLNPNEPIEIDFEGISSLSPSWADEFLTPLTSQYGDKLTLLKTTNLSAKDTISFLEEINNIKFNRQK